MVNYSHPSSSRSLHFSAMSAPPSPLVSLPDKVHELGTFVALRSGIAVGMNLLEQECHVVGEGSHGLHSFAVPFYLALTSSVGDVPVL